MNTSSGLTAAAEPMTKISTDHDIEKTAKRSRASRPKVKTGCSSCKQRRIKCDEKRPACTQCLKGRRDCTGYPPPPRHAVSYTHVPLAPRPLEPQQTDPIPSQLRGGPVIVDQVIPPPRGVKKRQHVKAIARRYMNIQVTPMTYGPSFTLPFSPVDFQYFNLFRSQTAAGHSGYFDSIFWTERVLQECHTDAAIRHASVALGALYKTIEESSSSNVMSGMSSAQVSDSEIAQTHWQMAVRKYSEACKAMMSSSGQNEQIRRRTRLTASVLLGSFDAFIGDHKQAITQIKTGLGLLNKIRHDENSHKGPYKPEPIEDELFVVFTRLAIQAKSYDLAFHFPEPYVVRLDPMEIDKEQDHHSAGRSVFTVTTPPNHRFTSLREARLAHDRLLERGLRFVEILQQAQNRGPGDFPESWKRFVMGYRGEMESWVMAFHPLLEARHSSDFSQQEKAALAALKMAQLNASITFSALFNSTETSFDAFIPQFKAIVDLGREVVLNDQGRAVAEKCPYPEDCRQRHWAVPDISGGFTAHHVKPSFSPEMGIIPPLFVVATKCRAPVLRRQAIQLLRSSSRREGMWDSALVARIGQWIMELEEWEEKVPASTYHDHQRQHQQDYQKQQQHYQSQSHKPPVLQHKFPSHIPPDSFRRASPTNVQLRPDVIPEEKRVMIQSVDFDLRARFANLKVGTRALHLKHEHDQRQRTTRLSW